ncbi:beta-ketoacyl synthase N-terminal-like domain-containing protein [Aliikangiella sp. IMCC44359]|uniref:beta-ketoacyl synthase N-terminal-like domain-containing protein n=1 Tax=Aliikangiella sp. IMCC44359 TaxID=3459125 RepID=UPI00403AA9C5
MSIYITGVSPMIPNIKSRSELTNFDVNQKMSLVEHDWFDPKVDLGGRGFRYFTTSTQYMLAAIKNLPEHNCELSDEAKGIIIGSNSCTRKVLDEMDKAIIEKGAEGINPMHAPSFCANVATGVLSIKNKAKAFNITLMNPMTAGLEAIIYAKNALLNGRAHYAIAGAMEDVSEFNLNKHYTVKTIGGACAVELASTNDLAKNNNEYLRIVEAASTFIPSADCNNVETIIRNILENQLLPILSKRNIQKVHLSKLNDSHSGRVARVLQDICSQFDIQLPKDEVEDTPLGCLDAVIKLSKSYLDKESALCIAISPTGQLSWVETEYSKSGDK